MNRYVKGARGERELLSKFAELGFSVMRSAGSGVNSISPDIIAVKSGRGFAFECKAWESSVAIEPEKYNVLKGWEANTGFKTFIAWRMNGKGWFFIPISKLRQTEKSYRISKKEAFENGLSFERLLSIEENATIQSQNK
ncbi:MAG: Holliday junction resolvase Hjc [Candidatus Micrarchaeia archaeon]|jgi:Holliday junction resolvase